MALFKPAFRIGVACRAALLAGFAAAFLSASVSGGWSQDREVVVFAAASLKDALDEVAEGWRAETGMDVTVSYAASSALARQIEAGAPADIFISADLHWMDELAAKRLIRSETRLDLIGNELVLISPSGTTLDLEMGPAMDLAGALGDDRLAMANTETVPAGKYGKAALEWLEVWDSVRDSVAQAENVRAALALVARGETPLGIVYHTDAAAEDRVQIIGTFPAESHPPIIYPAAITAASDNPDAEVLLAYFGSEEAGRVFRKHGFKPLD